MWTSVQVTEVKEYLGSLGLTDGDISKVVKEFNEVIACSVEGRLKANMAVLKEQWRMPEKAAVATVKVTYLIYKGVVIFFLLGSASHTRRPVAGSTYNRETFHILLLFSCRLAPLW